MLLAIQFIFTSCTNSGLQEREEKTTDYLSDIAKNQTEFNINKIDSRNSQNSIFENELTQYTAKGLKNVKIEIDSEKWIINQKKYQSLQTIYSSKISTARWFVDLSKFIPVGKHNGIIIFSADGMVDSDVLVAFYSNVMFFLVSGNILQPQQYTVSDFNVEMYSSQSNDGITKSEINLLWSDHIAKKSDIRGVLSEDAPPVIRFRLKAHDELIYSFGYYYFDNNKQPYYATPLPFEVTEIT